MAPQVNISPVTFGRLQRCAEPLVDDIESVINKLLDLYENRHGTPAPVTAAKIDVGTTPNLAWAKLLSGEVGGKPLKKVDWNALLIEAVEQAAKKMKTPEEISELIIVPRVLGVKTEAGYRFIPSAGVSVQGQDANGAWKATAHIAKALNLPVKVFFRWYENEKASNPGQTGKLSLNVE